MVETHAGRVFFFCSVRGGGNSLTHWRLCVVETQGALCFWRVRGCVWLKHMQGAFFFVLYAAGEIHSLIGASAAVCG